MLKTNFFQRMFKINLGDCPILILNGSILVNTEHFQNQNSHNVSHSSIFISFPYLFLWDTVLPVA